MSKPGMSATGRHPYTRTRASAAMAPSAPQRSCPLMRHLIGNVSARRSGRAPRPPGGSGTLRALMLVALVPGVHGALSAELKLDDRSVIDLLSSNARVCGDAAHRESCLNQLPCAAINVLCSADDPVWTPDRTQGSGGPGSAYLWRSLFPPGIGSPHPNEGSLQPSKNWLFSTPIMRMLPRAQALYMKPVGRPHAKHCRVQYCKIPAELYRNFDADGEPVDNPPAFPSPKQKVSLRARATVPARSRRPPPAAAASTIDLSRPRFAALPVPRP